MSMSQDYNIVTTTPAAKLSPGLLSSLKLVVDNPNTRLPLKILEDAPINILAIIINPNNPLLPKPIGSAET